MIKASELRLGNACMMPSSNKVTFITAIDISDIQLGYKTRIPIPLTEEWLTILGFERDNRRYSPTKFLYQKYPITFYTGDKYIKLNGYYEYNIMYVHQLQNLFHVLTGEELIISPTA